MEVLYNKLKKKDVVSLIDGRNLGRVCDLAFDYPANKLCGYFVTGSKGFHFNRQDIFIPVANIVKIGEDVVLTNFTLSKDGKEAKDNNQNNCRPPQQLCPPEGMTDGGPNCKCNAPPDCPPSEPCNFRCDHDE